MYKVKELPFEERPRERLIKGGAAKLSTIELLAIILRTGTKEEGVLDLSARLISETGTIQNLSQKTIEELMEYHGIGLTKAVTLRATFELGLRCISIREERVRVLSASDIYRMYRNDYLEKQQEVMSVVFLDLKSKVITKQDVFIGTLNQSLIHPREIFKLALKYSAYSIILIHNHPSGDPSPSREDIEVTKRFIEIGELMQIKIVDHIVFGHSTFESIMKYIND